MKNVKIALVSLAAIVAGLAQAAQAGQPTPQCAAQQRNTAVNCGVAFVGASAACASPASPIVCGFATAAATAQCANEAHNMNQACAPQPASQTPGK